ncbi:TetR/AcrR family transcriptional regulator [Lacticaseibacillus rhamnosus]|uniref:TetR/AcrR family transcriptional regulator n=1 Tax=Lacticaseibacillus rhamnosus TaxID=47715 RepID=UPI002FD87D68
MFPSINALSLVAYIKKKKYQNGQECYFNLKVGPKKVTLKKKVILMSKFQETDQTIQQAFFKVLAAEPFETITINKICSAAKISRTTFYRHYMDKYALLSKVNHAFSSALAAYLQRRIHQTNIADTLVLIAKYLSTNAKPISDLLRVHTPESDLSVSFQKIFHAKFARYIDYELSKGAVTAFPVAYLIELYVAIAMVFLSYSLKKGLDVAVVQSLNDFQKQIFTEKSEN